jgi:hypothetical protein
LGFITQGTTIQAGTVNLVWQASTNPDAIGYDVYYGEASGVYTARVAAGSNLTAEVTGLAAGVTYYFAVAADDANGDESAFSNEVTNRLPLPPAIRVQPRTQVGVSGLPVTLTVSVIGDPPLSFQWRNGLAPIPGATSSFLSWPRIGSSNAGLYSVIISNPWGSVTSSLATLSVINPPSILTQPQSQTVIATTAASFSTATAGTAPLFLQWYDGTSAIPGATNSVLAWATVAAPNAGNYHFTVSNAGGTVTSSVATLTVLPTNLIATAAGAYNGLFFQTNANGTPDITEASAGLLGNCVIATNGTYSAKLYVGGLSYALTGVFNGSGNTSGSIPRTNAGLSNLTVVLHVDINNGTQEITGSISGASSSNGWTAPLVADRATNAYPRLALINLLFFPGSGAYAPTNYGTARGFISNSVVSLSGVLGDATAITQTVPISKDGNVPVYVNLYNNGGLLEGWLNLAGSGVVGNLRWIYPGSGPSLAGAFNTVVQVTGTILNE